MAGYLTRILCVLLWFVVCSTAHAENPASIKLDSTTQSIYLGDSVLLDVESTGLLDPLDVDSLKERSDFLRETTGTRIAVVEGKVVEIAIRRMEFIPKQTGSFVFGPLTGEASEGQISSNSVAIKIQDALSTKWQPGETELQDEISFSNPSPIVGEQIIVDIKLRHTHQIANEQITLPVFSDFDVLPIFEQRRTIEGDSDWRQVAWRYLLHAKHSGEINIGPVQWDGTMIKSRSQRGKFSRTITAPALPVRSAPSDRPDWWLPATSVTLSDAWSKEVITLSAGDEIIRTITLRAENALSSQLPDIAPYPTRALTSTLIRTTRDHELKNDHTIATATFEYRMVAQSPIPVFLDTVRVPWWDVNTNTLEEAILPARRINVGLPDRADLLAELAINQSNWSRLALKLRGYARWQPILIALCLLMLFLALLPLIRDGISQHRHAWHRRVTIRKLEQLRANRNWTGLYRALCEAGTQKCALNTDSREYQALMQALQIKLFDENSIADKILEKKIQLPFSQPTMGNQSPSLRSL